MATDANGQPTGQATLANATASLIDKITALTAKELIGDELFVAGIILNLGPWQEKLLEAKQCLGARTRKAPLRQRCTKYQFNTTSF